MNTDIIKKQTATEMAEAYVQACQLVDEGYRTLAKAQNLLDATFSSHARFTSFDVIESHTTGFDLKERLDVTILNTVVRLRKGAWRRILDLLEIDKIVTVKRLEEIRKNIENGALPDIRVENIYDMVMSFAQNAPAFREELVKEVYEILRPHPRWSKEYKTNSQDQVGKKVILTWMIENKYGGGFRVRYGRSHDELMAIDKVFHLLDGQGIPEGYEGPLIDAIQTAADGQGETAYFKFQAYQNNNIHLTFKRLDLVKLLNQVAGGGALKSGKNGKG